METKSGRHLAVVRTWIQWNAVNGDSVTWGSNEPLVLKNPLTPRILEELAQSVRTVTEEDLPLQVKTDDGEVIDLLPFLKLMHNKLNLNKHKTMQGATAVAMFRRLLMEVRELYDALKEGDRFDIRSECADVANFAQFITQALAQDETLEDCDKLLSLSTLFKQLEDSCLKVDLPKETPSA